MYFIVKSRWFSMPRGVISNSSDFALRSVFTQHWEAVEGAASFAFPKTAKQVYQLLRESHRP
jgi:hypothetical protein